MTDAEIRTKLKEADDLFDRAIKALEPLAKEIANKVKRDTGLQFKYHLGHPEAGSECICLEVDEDCKDRFPSQDAAWDYTENAIEPLFKGCKHVYFEEFCGLY